MLLLALTLLIGTVGVLVYWSVRADIRENTHRTLAVIAEQKRQQLETLIAQTRIDAETYFYSHSGLEIMFRQWLDSGRQNTALLAQMQTRMAAVAQRRNWGGLAVFDAEARPVFAVGQIEAGEHLDLVRDILRQPRLEFLDLHRHAQEVPTIYGVLAPLGPPDAAPLGAALVIWQAEHTLYPLVESWPVPTRTAETFLIRPEGDQIRYLTPLRHHPDAALALTRPLDTPALAGSKAALGQHGILESGRDYRNVPILAYATPIAGTPWLMVAKMDQNEAYADLRTTFWVSALVLGLTLALLYGAGFYLWRQDTQRRTFAAFQREQAMAAEQQRTLRLLEAISDSSTDAVYAKDRQGRYLMVNQALARMVGQPADAVLGRDDTALFPPAQAAVLMAQDRQVLAGEALVNLEQTISLPNGARTFLTTKGPLRDADGTIIGVCGVSHDITQRKLIEWQAQENARQMQSIFENVPIGMFKSTPAGQFLFVNSTLAAMLGFDSPAHVIATVNRTSITEAIYEDTPHRPCPLQTFRQGVGVWQTFENRYRRRDGSTFTGMVTLSEQPDPVTGQLFIYGFVQDITERLRQEEVLRTIREDAARHAGEQRWKQALDAAGHGVWDWNIRSDIVDFSVTLTKILGYTTKESASNQSAWREHLHPEDVAAVSARLQNHLEGRTPGYESIHRLRHKDGGWRWILDRGLVIERGPAGEPLRMIGTDTDITAQREAEDRLRQSEDTVRQQWLELDAIYSSAPIGLCVLDTELRYQRINTRLAEINGVSVAGHLGRTVREIVPDLADTAEPLFRQILTTGKPLLNLELSGETAAQPGVQRFWQEHFYALRDATGQIIGINGVVEEITHIKQAEQNLRDSEQRFRALFEHLPIAYHSLDGEGRWLDANQTMADLLGFARPEEMRGLSFADYWDEAMRGQFDALFSQFKQNLALRRELRLRRRDGSSVTVITTGRVQLDAAGQFLRIHSVLTDISERRAMEDAIRELNADLERRVEERTAEARAASAAKSEFLAHMSHEIRTPMNGVLGLAQVLSREPLTTNQRDMVERIQAAGQALLIIINDILDFSKIEAGQLRLESRPFDLMHVLARVENLMSQPAQTKGIALRFIASEPAPGWLVGDGLRLEQILFNLIGNAIKFTERGGVVLRIQAVEPGETAVRLRFEVQDTGIGIAPEALARLFTPFTQAEAGTTRRFGGTGLGLAICKRLVEVMGGGIGADSQAGEGSTFWFELPFLRAPAGAPEATVASQPARAAGPRLTGMRVLVVDDSAMNRDVVERALGLEGATATPTADGQQAVQLLKTRPEAFDAVLMDIQMPVMDGLTATRLIRSELGLTGLPIIAFTAGVLAEQQQAARAAGANDLLAKPVELEQMVAVLSRWTRPGAATLSSTGG